MAKYNMPVGKSDFAQVRTDGDYYIDKTDLIRQIASSGTQVTLFTRPRRFGKSLNMSMLQHFFDIREDSKALFAGLSISDNKEICGKWMNQYPTVLVSFKSVDSTTFDNALAQLKAVLSELFRQHLYILDDPKIDDDDIETIQRIKSKKADPSDLMDSLSLLTRLLYHHYNKPVVLLIDEYDVPMAKGASNKYYDQITDIMRSIYSKSLKDNPYIKIAVLTGCLRIAKESIFTGLNNLKVYSILDYAFEEYFGFTDKEIDKLLSDTGFTEYKDKIRQWYDGYRFGDTEIYCPWDVLNYISDLQHKAGIEPKNYWANTSSNDIIRQYLDEGIDPQSDFETLLQGRCIYKMISDDTTYRELLDSEDNFWSILLMTGYLTVVPESEAILSEKYTLARPGGIYLRLVNNEIKNLFEKTVAQWFKDRIYKDSRKQLFEALWNGDSKTLAELISRYLRRTISYYDYSEEFYHAFLAGLFSGIEDIAVTANRRPGGVRVLSNRETGEGRADIVVENRMTNKAAVLEFKVTDDLSQAPSLCDVALAQIQDIGYAEALQEDEGYELISYGVVFYKKRCFVKKG